MPDELEAVVGRHGAGPGRARTLFAAAARQDVERPRSLRGVDRDLRAALDEDGWHVRPLTLHQVSVSALDPGTEKYLFLTRDGLPVESVLMPAASGRTTLCISSQVGCRMGCRFCRTATMGLVRSLTPGEMVSQYAAAAARARRVGRPAPTNVVFMGMGEPLDATDALFRATDILNHPLGHRLSRDRMTISTCGLVPGIDLLGARGHRTNLAVSLNAPDDALRSGLMPVNRRWPLAELMAALRRFPLRPGRTIVIEYVLMAGINDSLEQARALAALLEGLSVKVNLIACNRIPGTPFAPSDHATVLAFADELTGVGRGVLVRRSRGADVAAACGQLGRRVLPSPAANQS